jgi:hypothetical protein
MFIFIKKDKQKAKDEEFYETMSKVLNTSVINTMSPNGLIPTSGLSNNRTGSRVQGKNMINKSKVVNL